MYISKRKQGCSSTENVVSLRDFPRSDFPTEVDRLRAFRNAYYRQYRQTHKEDYRNTQSKYLNAHPWQKIYRGIKTRCNNKNSKTYFYYGAQGVKCLLSLKDVKFLWFRDKAHLLLHPSIDRIDPYGHYSLENCRFIELSENSARTVRKIKNANRE